ncbi:hypothetical protein AB1Y20_000921 [Prymnesium parvum]|uniref:Mitogen-activated protein kinase n=1 Tax=Prymnesium parvum TaxID=97485 RepID=A0AB34K6U2_PRYPA
MSVNLLKDRFFRGVRSDLEKRYQLSTAIGRGAYGEVWSASDAHGVVAIKKINNCFAQTTEAKRILRELRILRHISHPHIIRIRDVLHPQSESSFTDVWVVFDFVDFDLRKLIASSQFLTIIHIQWISVQILEALRYLHSAHVLHRDLKPANVLVNDRCDVKICDFGLARVFDEDLWKMNEDKLESQRHPVPMSRQSSSSGMGPMVTRQMTTHVVTRWYRAPELILLQRYTTAIDMWSFGCIFFELLTMLPESKFGPGERNALFPGQSCFPLSPTDDEKASPASLDQLNVIFAVIGTPKGPFNWIERKEMREHLSALDPVEPTPLLELFPATSQMPQNAIDFLNGMLAFEPGKRTTVANALAHPFLDSLANHAPGLLAAKPVDAATIDFEHTDIKLPQVRRKILDEIHYYSQRRTISATSDSGIASEKQDSTPNTIIPQEPDGDEANRKRKRREASASADVAAKRTR